MSKFTFRDDIIKNKKTLLIILIIIIILVIAAFLTKNNTNHPGMIRSCVDSDGGADYFIKGYITYPTTVYNNGSKIDTIAKEEDRCLRKIASGEPIPKAYHSTTSPDGKTKTIYETGDCLEGDCYIMEYTCNSGVPDYHSCPNGCKDEACIK